MEIENNIHPGFKAIAEFDAFADRDTNRIEYQLALFYPKENRFFKIACIDFRNYRYEVWAERMSRWLKFQDAFVFNWCDPKQFDPLFELYKNHPGRIKYMSKKKLMTWFLNSESRISFMSRIPEELDEGQYGDMFNPKNPANVLNQHIYKQEEDV